MTLKTAFVEHAAPAKPMTEVSDAAAFLDEHFPGWYRRVKPGTLRMGDAHTCVAGQLGLDYALMQRRSGNPDAFGSNQEMVLPWTTEVEYRLALDFVNA
jgi:hypothetical protein